MEYYVCVNKELPYDVAMFYADRLTKRKAYKLKRKHPRKMVVYKVSMTKENVV